MSKILLDTRAGNSALLLTPLRLLTFAQVKMIKVIFLAMRQMPNYLTHVKIKLKLLNRFQIIFLEDRMYNGRLKQIFNFFPQFWTHFSLSPQKMFVVTIKKQNI
jgi:hypothetical protein